MVTIKCVVFVFFAVAFGVTLMGYTSATPTESTKLRQLMSRVVRETVIDLNATDEHGRFVYCKNKTPCKWEVYQRFTRLKDYDFNNTCICEPGKICIRNEDDISIHAYVHRCTPISSVSKEDLALLERLKDSLYS